MIRDFLHDAICWAIERTQEAEVISGLRFHDLRYKQDDRPADVLRAAMAYFPDVDASYAAKVLREVRMVVASTYQESIYPSPGAYFTRFRRWEGGSPLFLASKLVWVSEYVSGARQRLGSDATLRKHCMRRQLAFLDAVGEDAEWIASLRRHAE